MSSRKDALFPWLSRIMRRRRRTPRGSRFESSLLLEQLEGRRLLAACSESPAIQGTVFIDADQDGQPSIGEQIADATVQLWQDDGDGILDTDIDVLVGSQQTDIDGSYCLDNLDGTLGYFVVQPSQTVDGIPLQEQASGLILPGTPNLIVDRFQTSQQVEAAPPPPSSESNTLSFPNEDEVIGAERDLFVELIAGASEVRLRVNPFGLLPVLQFDATSGVLGRAVVTWDGMDGDGNPNPSMGLGGRDLTDAGQNVGFAMNLGIDASGAGEQVTVILYQGDASNFSTASADIPVTDGTASAFLFLPFSDFSGPVSASNVDAIQLLVGNGVASADGQLDVIGVVGPKVQDFANGPVTDLAATKTDNVTSVVPGEDVTYLITVQNNGPLDVSGATVQDQFTSILTDVSYTSTAIGNASGNTPEGTGNINDTVDIAVGASIVYTANATVLPAALGTLTNAASVSVPAGVTDPIPVNNNAVDIDTLTPEVDLTITKTDGVDEVSPGGQLDYTIVVTNSGPSDVQGARVVDSFPAPLTNVSYTSNATGDVSGQTPSGTGNIDDTVNMGVGSQLVYSATATVADTASGTISNTAIVTAPDGTTERDPSDNQSTDETQVLNEADLVITKTDDQETAVPGETLTYTIVVQNLGPGSVSGAVIQDTFPGQLSNVTYVSSSTGTVSGNSPSGSGNLSDIVAMSSGSSITYTVTATVSPAATGQLENTATVTPPANITDPDLGNNSSTDINTLTPLVDLIVTKTSGQVSAVPNQPLTYTITVTNTGPSDVVGAEVLDAFPGELANVSYTSAAQGGASGNTTSGVGNIEDTVNLPVGATITYTVASTVRAEATQDVANTAIIAPPVGVTEINPGNNTATEIDVLLPGVDLAVTKTSDRTTVGPGQSLTYTIIVSNNGPNPVNDAQVLDGFPDQLTGVTYTSQASAGASGNTTSGSGDINDNLNLAAGSSVIYTASGTIAEGTSGTMINFATVTAPGDVIELDPANNTDSETNIIDSLLASISGFVYVDLNNDGVRDPDEPPIADVEIILEPEDQPSEQTTTDETGAYEFENLTAGNYLVQQIQPLGYRNGKDTVGGGIGAVVAKDTFFVALGSGQQASELNFGELPLQPSKREMLASSFAIDPDALVARRLG